MDVKDLVYQCRSYRRYNQERVVPESLLLDLIDLGRMSPHSANRQWLRYAPIVAPDLCAQVFETLGWAGYLPDWPGPAEGERPAAYIVMLEDAALGSGMPVDAGFAAQSILLGAMERGIAACVIHKVKRKTLSELLQLPETAQIPFVIALGYPAEKVVVEPMPASGDVRYWRDEQGVHHVPKRSLEEVIFRAKAQ